MKNSLGKLCAMILIPLISLLNCPVNSVATASLEAPSTEILHDPIEETTAGDRIPIEATIEDVSGVINARIYFKAKDAGDYLFVTLDSTDAKTYTGLLPAPANGVGSIEYLILVQNGVNQVVKSQTFIVAVTDNERKSAAAAENSPINVFTELRELPADISGFTDNIVLDVVESSAKLGVIAGLYHRDKAGESTSGAVAGGTAAASAGTISATTIAVGVVAAGAVIAAVAAGGGGGSSDSNTSSTADTGSSTTAGSSIVGTWNGVTSTSTGTYNAPWIFYGNNTWAMTLNGQTLTGSWNLNGTQLTLNSSSGPATGTYTTGSNQFSVTSADGTTWNFTR